MSELESFDQSLRAILRSVRNEEPSGTARDLDVVLTGLGRYLRASFPGVSRQDVVDAVDLAVVRTVDAAKRDLLDPDRNPGPYVARVAHNAMLEILNRGAIEEPRPDVTGPEEERVSQTPDPQDSVIAALASELEVQALRERISADGQEALVRLLDTWLDLSRGSGTSPSLRTVAVVLGVSHTEVANRMRSLRDYLA